MIFGKNSVCDLSQSVLQWLDSEWVLDTELPVLQWTIHKCISSLEHRELCVQHPFTI